MNIKQFIKDRISQNTLNFIRKYVLLHGVREKMSVYRRSKLDYFQYEQISKPVFNSPSKYQQNKGYGQDRAIKKFDANYNSENSTIEHGIYFMNDALLFDLVEGVENIYTFGEFRAQAIRNSNRPTSKSVNIIKVGPYIKYADNFHSEEKLAEIKKELGSVLLVFPSHSITFIHTEFDYDDFIEEIKSVGRNYDTILVCMFYKDIELELHKEYLKAGIRVVSAGIGCDQYFLSRLKDLIELSDMTMSNNLGTHLGYCIALGKPHYLYNQEVAHIKLKQDAWSAENGPMDDRKNKQDFNKIKAEMYSLFSSKEPLISQEQIDIVKYYWGEF